MAQLSRPYQIALAATVFLALVWFVALRGHAASTATPAASAPAKSSNGGAARPVGASHTATPRASTNKSAASTHGNGIPPRQAAVESELKRGEVAVILFWNKHGADDVAVHGQLQILLAAHHEVAIHPNKAQVRKLRRTSGLELEKKIAVHYAYANEVLSFGTFTKTVQVYGTPTILIVNRHGAVTTLNGLQDVLSIEQAIDEARHAQS